MAFNHTFKYLLNGKEVLETRSLSASRAIRYNCLDCAGGSQVAVKDCHIEKCPLWPFRMGKSRPRLPPELRKKHVFPAQGRGSSNDQAQEVRQDA